VNTILVVNKVYRLDFKTKYLSIHWHCAKECRLRGMIAAEWVPTEENVADVLTKLLRGQDFVKHHSALVVGEQCVSA
jgi:hypothetical protein